MPDRIKIFIASSAEVNPERERAVLSLTELNKTYPCLHLEPVLWEIDMVKGNYPGFATIQDAINPKLEESNLVVFIFYTKLGKNTRIEFDLAKAQNKKMLVFFRDGFSPRREHMESYAELLDFKESLEDVLRISYSDEEDFYNELYRNLNLYLSGNHPCREPARESEAMTTLSRNNQELIQLLMEKDREISALRNQLELSPRVTASAQLDYLQKERDALVQQLQQSDEVNKQQVKDLEVLGKQLSLQKDKDDLKAKAFKAVEEKNYGEAEVYLMESARDSFKETAATFYELAKIKKIQYKYAEALANYERAILLDPENAEYLSEAGGLAIDAGFYDRAIPFIEKALHITLKLYGEEHTDIANGYNNLGLAYNRKGEYDKAISYGELALIISKKLYGEDHPDVATSYNNLGLVYDDKGEYDKAISYYELALEIGKKLYGKDDPNIATSYNNLGSVYDNKGEYDKAIDFYELALTIDRKFYGEEHPIIAQRFNNLGGAYVSKGSYDKAINYFEMALAIYKNLYGEEHLDIATWYNNLGSAYWKKKEYDKAISYYEMALVIDKKFHGEEHPAIAIRYNNLGSVYDDKGEYDKAISFYNMALPIDKKFYGEEHPNIAIRYSNLGLAYVNKGQNPKAIDLLTKALGIFQKFLPPEHPSLITCQNNLKYIQERLAGQNKNQ